MRTSDYNSPKMQQCPRKAHATVAKEVLVENPTSFQDEELVAHHFGHGVLADSKLLVVHINQHNSW